MLSAGDQEVVPVHEPVVGVGVDSPGLAVDDPGEVRNRCRIDLQHPVDLLLVLGQVDGGPAVGQEVLDLRSGIGRVEADRDATHGHGREVQDDPFGAVLRLDGDPVAYVDSEGQQAVGGVHYEVPGAGPGVLLPDAEVLLPHGDAVRVTGSPVAGEAGDGDRRGLRIRGGTFLNHQCHVPPPLYPPIGRSAVRIQTVPA